jgi:hypothetical protein
MRRRVRLHQPGALSKEQKTRLTKIQTFLAGVAAPAPEMTREHMAVLNERHDLTNRPASHVTRDRGKPV